MDRKDTVVSCIVCFLIGVICASLEISWLKTTAAAVVAILVLSSFQKKLSKTIQIILVCSSLCGYGYYIFFVNSVILNYQDLYRQEEFTGTVSTEVRRAEKSKQFALTLTHPNKGSVIKIITKPEEYIEYGNTLTLRGTLEESELPNWGPKKFLPPTLFFPKITAKIASEKKDLVGYLFLIKEKIISNFKNTLPASEAALISGILLGYKDGFNKDFLEKLSASGTTHIVAISGYNITIIIIWGMLILNTIIPRKAQLVMLSLSIILFVIAVGSEASAVRAAITAECILIARELGREVYFPSIIAISALLMTIYNPTIVVFDIGFQLSFLSLIGIFWLEPRLSHWITKNNQNKATILEVMSWKKNMIATISAQLMVLPFLLWYFNNASLIAVLSNMLILEFIPFTMFLGIMSAIIGQLWIPLSYIISIPLHLLLAYEITVIDITSNWGAILSIQGMSNQTFGTILFFSYYALLFLIASSQERSDPHPKIL